MALLLLAGAGVTVKSLWRLFQLDQGFERDQVLVFRTPRRGNPGAEEWRRSCERFLSEVERLPGVISAAMAFGTPLNGTNEGASFQIEGQAPSNPAHIPRAGANAVGPNYFRTLKIPFRSGRDFSLTDTEGSQPVAIVSESLARKYWSGRDPVGMRIRIGASPDEPWGVVVGTVGDVRECANAPASPLLYRPCRQAPARAMGYVVRTGPPPRALGPSVQHAIHALDAGQPITFLRPLADDFVDQIYPQRVSSIGLVAFSGIAAGGVRIQCSLVLHALRQL